MTIKSDGDYGKCANSNRNGAVKGLDLSIRDGCRQVLGYFNIHILIVHHEYVLAFRIATLKIIKKGIIGKQLSALFIDRYSLLKFYKDF